MLRETLKRILNEQGAITSADTPALMSHDPFMRVLVICNLGRFTCPLKDLALRMADIDKQENNHVRYVSFTATDADQWRLKLERMGG